MDEQEEEAGGGTTTEGVSPPNPDLVLWERAVQAAQLRAHYPSPGDALIPWSHGTESADVCTLEPVPCPGRATLFLRTSLAAPDLARRLNDDFFEALGLTVKVRGATDASKTLD